MKIKEMMICSFVVVALAGCSRIPGASFLARETATSTPIPTATVTPIPTITPTPTSSPTPIPAARVILGDRASRLGDWDASIAEYQTALQASPDKEVQAAALLGMSRTELSAGQIDRTIETLTRLVQEYPEYSRQAYAFFVLAQAFTAQERYAEAAVAYGEYLKRQPGLIDGYVLELRGDAYFAAGDYVSAAADYRSALASPGLLDSTFLEMKEARAYALGGDTARALALYADLYNRTSNDFTKALIDLRRGQIYTDLGQLEQAYAVYQDAVNNYPKAYEAYSALVALVEAGVAVDELNRGLVDYYAGEYGAAAAALDRYLQNIPAQPGTARYYSGLAKREQGSYEAAINDWEKVIINYPDDPYWDDAWEQKADTQWRFLDEYELAVQTLLDFVAAAPAHDRAGEFLFDAAQIAERNADYGQAAELWERVANLYPADERAGRALFLAGLARYRLGDYAGAFLSFERLAGFDPDPAERAKANFWIGKAQQKLGDEAAARASWEAAADLDPTGYYSERAVDLLQGRDLFGSPLEYDLAVDPGREQKKAERWLITTFGLPEGTDFNGLGDLANDPRLQRGTELWEVGLSSEARAEFEDLRLSLSTDPAGSYRLARYLSEIGLYRSAALAARQVLNQAGMNDAETLNAPAYFNYLRFPTYYKELVISAAEKNNIHPLFLFSLIRQESLFESFVRSSAAARGLMQIMPATGADIAKNLGWPEGFTTADLDRPLVNITLGVDYLETQRNLFDGNLFAALAAYNGGPGNASEWLKLAQDDPDLFLEVIRYSETRDYVRSIYEIFNIYRRLYNRSP